jgi:hypothetical protein
LIFKDKQKTQPAAQECVVVVDELGHFPVETDRQQAQQKTAEQGEQDRLLAGTFRYRHSM